MNTEVLCKRPFDSAPLVIRWLDSSPIAGPYKTASGTVTVKHGHLVGGKSADLEVLVIDTGAVKALVLPGRGMGIWKLWSRDIEFGWTSPVDGPVHPSLVPVMGPDGLGWLEGFDELVVRCGLESNGAPEFAENGTLRYPLHGRIANLPANRLAVTVDPESGAVDISGEIIESKLFFQRLRLNSTIRVQAGSSQLHLLDRVTNDRAVPATMQMLYHINVGSPVLDSGATVCVNADSVKGKDDRSQAEIDQWNQMGAPQVGYAERVYFLQLERDSAQWSHSLLANSDRKLGLGVSYKATTLPHFILWKNTAAKEDGYVIGLEPATNLPNTRSSEQAAGRVVTLEAGQSQTFEVKLCPCTAKTAVEQFAAKHALTIKP